MRSAQLRVRRSLVAAVAAGLALTATPATAHTPPAPGTNAPVKVTLKVQGPDGVLFQGKVRTRGHDVTTATGGTHRCDGTNNGAHPSAVPTPTAALDDAARKHRFTWDGAYYPAFDDYFVQTIKNVSGTATAYWNISVNGTPTPVGGCQFKLAAGDQVAFTWTTF
ncbi:DUF4430 domain-containing protein [Streptomyces clavuligerus]|uniref:DUF4430 domain-containing protein n=1 Tax=Streptomyces clavuligerus TaxID=1901 RepID=UPI0008104A0A|nr:DUF4430 domain-containing protein [Streptomyces clavuligerus]ANW17076.1 DUF4430 domain-containing protein [Streptomyces clavuligerus]AXU11613.1 DUF4430 domain-containing protein [Streptomyces clavuligerus]MBY6301441.1 DUF4430 domain-containing protein [Streptomyces clavuligerus]QPL61731.1 DUF4430 domain-containing protein [Streptomyces clavuligerus]QPL67764.1 DUF4430 domain-containing protein [Streptomyces clavuligerus]